MMQIMKKIIKIPLMNAINMVFHSATIKVSARIVRFNDDADDSEEVKDSSKVSFGTEEAIAGHFVADVSNFTSTENPRLRNSNGIFQIWRQAKWMNKDKAERWFKLDGQDGTVTIQLGGLYQIYSQVKGGRNEILKLFKNM
jgi:hypothetical protein